jgi:signal peptidase I
MNKTYVLVPISIASMLLVFPFIVGFENDVMVINSDSMIPALQPYDIIIVQNESVENIKVGDIIVFDSHVEGINIIAHRVIEKHTLNDKIGIDTKGDNVSEIDPWTVYEEDLIGKVVGHISLIGMLLIEPVRYALIIIIIVAAVSLLKEVTSEIKSQKNK